MPNCDECERHFQTWEALQQHLRNSSKPHPYCSFCDKFFSSEQGYNQHTASKHTDCFHCGRIFADDEACRQHRQAIHVEECHRCDRTFTSQDALADHYRDSASHPTCYNCNRGFVDDQAYHQHRTAIHGDSRKQRWSTRLASHSYNTYPLSGDNGDIQPGYGSDLRTFSRLPTEDPSVVSSGIPSSLDLLESALRPSGDILLSIPPAQNASLDLESSNELPPGNLLPSALTRPSHADETVTLNLHQGPDQLTAPSISHVILMPSFPAQPKLYKNLLSLIWTNLSRNDFTNAKTLSSLAGPLKNLQELVIRMAALNTVMALSHSRRYRVELLGIVKDLEIPYHDENIRLVLDGDEKELFSLLQGILNSKEEKGVVLGLKNEDADHFMTLIQNFLDHKLWQNNSKDSEFYQQALRLLVKLAEASQMPSCLFIHGVSCLEGSPRVSGGFADIFQAEYQVPGSAPQKVALKRLRISQRTQQESLDFRRRFFREALVWKNLQHPHILPFLGVDSETFHLSIGMVSPWMEDGTICQYMESYGPSNINVNKYLFQVALGVEYLHVHNLVHGDLHAKNILIDKVTGNARLADFGLIGFVEATAGTHTSYGGGTVRWMAPELLHPAGFGFDVSRRTPASDVYAFSCVCIEVHTGSSPFSDIPLDVAVILKVVQGERPSRPCNTPGISDYLWELMGQCWKGAPSGRPKIEDIVQSMKEMNFGQP